LGAVGLPGLGWLPPPGGEYLQMLEEYKAELEQELREVEQEIESLK